jgi:hypothetical protein
MSAVQPRASRPSVLGELGHDTAMLGRVREELIQLAHGICYPFDLRQLLAVRVRSRALAVRSAEGQMSAVQPRASRPSVLGELGHDTAMLGRVREDDDGDERPC